MRSLPYLTILPNSSSGILFVSGGVYKVSLIDVAVVSDGWDEVQEL